MYNIPRSHFSFIFLQICDFAHKHFIYFPYAPPPSATDTILSFDVCSKGSISKLINTFVTLQSIPADSLRISWSSELKMEIDQETWEVVLDRVHSSSICACHCFIQCKVVHRVHWSKCKLARIDPTIDPECDMCHLGPFWGSVFNSLTAITSVDIPPSPIIGLFGVLPSDYPLPTYFTNFVAFLTLLARRVVLNWKSPQPPSHTRWLKDALYFMKLEKIRHSSQGPNSTFNTIWKPFLTHVKTVQLESVWLTLALITYTFTGWLIVGNPL